jgi:hypothetical protein
MGKYAVILDPILRTPVTTERPKTTEVTPRVPFGRFGRAFTALETRCPDHVPVERWQQAIEDGRRFLPAWGSQAEALGWTSADLFGLHTTPEQPHPSYSRLSRYDCTGLCWLLQGRRVTALSADTAAIENSIGGITMYRRFNKPALGAARR